MSAAAATTLEAAALAQGFSAKIIEQVAYYLSPANLQRDAFLAQKLREGGGYVPPPLTPKPFICVVLMLSLGGPA